MSFPSKSCTKCNETKPAEAFSIGRGHCRECANAYFKQWEETTERGAENAAMKARRHRGEYVKYSLEARITRDTKTLEILKAQVKAKEYAIEHLKARLADALTAPAPKAVEVSVRPLTKAQIRAKEIDEEVLRQHREGETVRATAWVGTQQNSPFGRNQ